jgi:hypothetical protein
MFNKPLSSDIDEDIVILQLNLKEAYMLHPIREISQFMNGAEYKYAQFMNWTLNEQRITQFVKWARVICPVQGWGVTYIRSYGVLYCILRILLFTESSATS